MTLASFENRQDRFEVTFSGPPMIRRTRGALAAAGITPLVDRHNGLAAQRAGASEMHEFVVLVPARDAGHAVERTRGAVQAGGAYVGFSAARRPD
jgi:hypothetical protein